MSRLPSELWGEVLAYLRVPEIWQCQLVCKMFYSLTHTVPECRFRLELASAGYSEPLNPRMDISMARAIDIFQAHLSRTASRSDDLSEFMRIGFDVSPNISTLTSSEIRPMLFGGVLARWSSVQSDKYLPLQVDIIRLPSTNKGTGLEQWKLIEPELDVQGYWMEPKYDLLVLLTSTYNANEQIEYCQFYLRTLSSNTLHPQAQREVLTYPMPRMWEPDWPSAAQIIGRLLIVRATSGPRWLLVWDWTTGRQHLAQVLTAGRGQGFGVLSSDTIMIPRCTFTYETYDQPIVHLDVFSFKTSSAKQRVTNLSSSDFNDHSDSSIEINHIATFELPIAHSAPEIPSDINWLHSTDLAVGCVCSIDPSFSPSPPPESPAYSPSLSKASEHQPAGVFEVSESNRVLRFGFNLPYIFSPDDNPDLDDNSWLLVPVHVFSSFIRHAELANISDSSANLLIFPWHEWGSHGRWVHNHNLSNFDWTVVTSGTRSLLLHVSSNCLGEAGLCDLCSDAPATPERPYVRIMDFDRRKVQQRAAEFRNRFQLGTGWVEGYHPAWPDCCTPSTRWLKDANIAVAPYLTTQFWHESILKFSGGQSFEVWIDDEHVVFLEASVNESL